MLYLSSLRCLLFIISTLFSTVLLFLSLSSLNELARVGAESGLEGDFSNSPIYFYFVFFFVDHYCFNAL